MNSIQYEELCRFYIAKKLRISVDVVKSIHVQNPIRPGLPQYKHQIDLYWETEDEVSQYLNIANAKWRTDAKVDQPEVLLLQQVKQKVGSHKALIITNTGFTSGADAAARDDRIGMHIVLPAFNYSKLPTKNREQIQQVMHETQSLATELIYRGDATYKSAEIELIEKDDWVEGLKPADLFLLSALRKRLGYLWMLSVKGYSVDFAEISKLETEIFQIRADAREYTDSTESGEDRS